MRPPRLEAPDAGRPAGRLGGIVPAATGFVAGIAAFAAFATSPHARPALALALWDGARGPVATFGRETWLAPGAPLPPAGWLGDAVLARVAPLVGLRGLGLIAALAFALALAIVEHRARGRGGALFAAAAVVLAFANALGAFGVGDGLATDALFTAATLAFLDRTGRTRAGVVLITFCWAWMSPHALLGVIFTAATAAGATFEARLESHPFDAPSVGARDRASEPRELWAVALAGLVATLLTPATYGYAWASIQSLHLDGAAVPYTVHPGDLVPSAYHAGFFALLGLAVACGGTYGARATAALRRRRGLGGARGAGDATVLAVAIVLGFFDGHCLPVSAVAAAPVLAGAAARRFGTPCVSVVAPLAVVAAGVLVLLGVEVADRRAGPTRFDASPLVAAIARDPGAHALYCSQPLWCDGALGSPVRVGLDSRTGWPAAALEAQRTVAVVGPHWSRTLERGGVDRVVTARTTALAGLLRLRPEWREIGEDGVAAAFARIRGKALVTP